MYSLYSVWVYECTNASIVHSTSGYTHRHVSRPTLAANSANASDVDAPFDHREKTGTSGCSDPGQRQQTLSLLIDVT